MRRTEVRQDVRMMKFRDVFGHCEEHELSKLEAAELLGVDERRFRRLVLAVLGEGREIKPRIQGFCILK